MNDHVIFARKYPVLSHLIGYVRHYFTLTFIIMKQDTVVEHELGQRFEQHEARIVTVKSFNTPAARQVDTTTGELVTKPAERRFQFVTKGDDGRVITLDSMNLEQLRIITGKELSAANMRLLRNATVTWYVSTRTEGQKYYFRPDASAARIAPRTGKFTSVALIEPADGVWDSWDEIADRDSTLEVADVDDKSFAAFQAMVKKQLAADKKEQ